MSEDNMKYPALVLGTDGVCEIFLEKGVQMHFKSKESIEEFFKKNNVKVYGNYVSNNRRNKPTRRFINEAMPLLPQIKIKK